MAAVTHRILLIDDEPNVLHSLERVLRREGVQILKSDNGPAALELLGGTDVAVIVCDQRMPHMTGDQVLAKAAKLRPDAYRITLTAFADLQAAQTLINQAGVNQFLLKPWDDGALRQAVQEGIRWYDLIQENRRLQNVTNRQKQELEASSRHLEKQVQERTEALRKQNEELVGLQRRLEQSLRDTVGALVGLLESQNPSMGVHCRRVAQLARDVGLHLDISPEEVRDIEFAALLHDIGKIARLYRGDVDFRPHESKARQMQLPHPESGSAILSHVGGFERIVLAVKHQQERFDGTGSPARLKGSQIPIGSRIIAVANAYDKAVFQAKDPLAISREVGRRVLLEGKGSKFDPQVVDLLLLEADYLGADSGGDTEIQLSPRQLRAGMVLSRPICNHKGLLLLKAGTVLTEGFIEHIRLLSDVDPLLADVFVMCGSASDSKPATAELANRLGVPDRPPDARMEQRESPASGKIVSNSRRAVAPEGRHDPRQAPASATEADEGSSEAQVSALRKKVLVINDSQVTRNLLSGELRLAGYDCACSANGEGALMLMDTFRPDVAISDLRMPDMSGEELIGHLRHCAPDLPCIIITGSTTLEQVKRLARSSNVVAILVKPWDHRRLIGTLQNALARSSSGAAANRLVAPAPLS